MRLVMKSGEAYCNTRVTEIVREDSILLAMRDGKLCGVFSIGSIDYCYLSEEKDDVVRCY